ncbi:histidinol dehydrogenase [Haloferula sargassicola]|uniref:Histidinol dehydrogenase n=1 Tax=Haloferula sargassicola TaxID=490096 RepID=A0ABP9UPV7_9BACT
MKTLTFRDPEYPEFVATLNRRAIPSDEVRDTVAGIISDVAQRGDAALTDYARRFDHAEFGDNDWWVTADEFKAAEKAVTPETKKAIKASLKNITEFAKRSMRKDWSYKNAEGARVGERFVPFDRVGVYVPGGKAPLVSTALMTAGFARAAKVPEVLAATPCGPDGRVNDALLYALKAAGVTEVIKFGGAQAIAAMALGTATIRPVDRVFGPGNKFVVEAKRQLVGAVSIDLLPGPSEILVLADKTGDAKCIAADLLAQAEHGGDSVIGLVTDSQDLLDKVTLQIELQAATLSRGDIIREVLEKSSFALVVKNLDEAVAIANDFAPEHLSLVVAKERRILKRIRTAGAIYLGNLSPVAVGDFLAGPSHTLPTGGGGRSFSGLRADQFQRRTSIVKLGEKAVARSLPHAEEFARIEGLDAHGRSVAVRIEQPAAEPAPDSSMPEA